MLSTVDLDDELPSLPRDVEPPSASPVISPSDLPVGLGKPEGSYDLAGEVQFGERMRASFDVVEGLKDELAPVQARTLEDYRTQHLNHDQSLLNARRQNGHRTSITRHPCRGVHQ